MNGTIPQRNPMPLQTVTQGLQNLGGGVGTSASTGSLGTTGATPQNGLFSDSQPAQPQTNPYGLPGSTVAQPSSPLTPFYQQQQGPQFQNQGLNYNGKLTALNYFNATQPTSVGMNNQDMNYNGKLLALNNFAANPTPINSAGDPMRALSLLRQILNSGLFV